jgi:uncharacterized membrane protein
MQPAAVIATIWQTLPWIDWLALAGFFASWAGYAHFARRRASVQPSLLALGNRERDRWMLQTTLRDNRVLDGVVVQNLSVSPQFFASTTILIIGGLLAALSTSEQASALVAEIPFAARTSALVFDMKLVLMVAVFVYGFFRFTWSLRQYSIGVLLVAAAPERDQYADEATRHAYAARAARVMALAAETFNDGLRAYYMSFAATAWFFSPWAMLAASAGVVWVLYRREFRSDVVSVLAEPV